MNAYQSFLCFNTVNRIRNACTVVTWPHRIIICIFTQYCCIVMCIFTWFHCIVMCIFTQSCCIIVCIFTWSCCILMLILPSNLWLYDVYFYLISQQCNVYLYFQIGAVTVNWNPDGHPELLASQPGRTYVTLLSHTTQHTNGTSSERSVLVMLIS